MRAQTVRDGLGGLLAVATAALAVALVAAAAWGTFPYVVYVDRDLVRAARLLDELPHAGAELGGGPGARLPGPLLGLLLALPRVAGPDAHPAFVFQAALLGVALVVLRAGLVRPLGAVGAGVAALLWGAHAVTVDTTRMLWNPGFLPLPIAVAVVGLVRATADRDARPLPWVVLAVALGGQLHASMFLLGGLVVAVVVALRPEGLRPALVGSVLAAAVATVPYALGEVLTGGENTRLLLAQPEVAARTWTVSWGRLTAVAEALAGGAPPFPAGAGLARRLGVVAGWALPVLLAGVGALATARRVGRPGGDPFGRVVLGAALALAGGAALYGLSVSTQLETRYLLVLVPLAAVLAGAGAEVLVASGGPGRVALVAALLLPGLTVRAAPLARFGAEVDGGASYRTMLGLLDATRALTGWSLQEMTGRTVWISVQADGRVDRPLSGPPVDHLLHAEGLPVPGSLRGACALLVEHPVGGAPDAAAAARLVDRAIGEAPADGVRTDALGRHHTLVRYTRHAGACPTSMLNRYVPTPGETALRPLWGRVAPGQVVEVGWPGAPLWVTAVPHGEGGRLVDDMLLVGVALVPDGAGVRAELHAPQLRGSAANGGWYTTVVVRRPGLRFVRGDQEHRVDFEPSFAGMFGAVTPLAVPVAVPPGPWEVHLVGEMIGVPRSSAWPPDAAGARPFDVVVAPSWSPPR